MLGCVYIKVAILVAMKLQGATGLLIVIYFIHKENSENHSCFDDDIALRFYPVAGSKWNICGQSIQFW